MINLVVTEQLNVVNPQKGGRLERRQVAFASDKFPSTLDSVGGLIHQSYGIAG